MRMTPPYDAPYWHTLTDRQKLNDLVHKVAQLRAISYPAAYAAASEIIDAPGPGSYAIRLARADRLQEAIGVLIEAHEQSMEAP